MQRLLSIALSCLFAITLSAQLDLINIVEINDVSAGTFAFDKTNDNGYIITGGNSIAIRTDSLGNVIFSTNLGGNSTNSVKTHNNEYVIAKRVGSGGTYTTSILKLDSTGNVIFEESISDGGAANHVLVLSDNNYVISGGTKPCGCGGSWEGRTTKFSQSGSAMWSEVYCVNCGCQCGVGDEMNHEAIDTGDGIIVAGTAGTGGSYAYGETDAYLLKYDYNGGVIWSKTHGDDSTYTGYNSIAYTENNNIISVGYIIDDNTVMTSVDSDFWIVLSDSNGNILWQKTIENLYDNVLNDVIVTNQNTFIVSGKKHHVVGSAETGLWLAEYDSVGNLLWEETLYEEGTNLSNSRQALLQNEQGEVSFLYSYDDSIYIRRYSGNIEGCLNEEACNFNPEANEDDGSCLYIDECGECGGEGILSGECDCDGNTLDALGVCGGGCCSDFNTNGICDHEEVLGCTYEEANNYNAEATVDDGSCVYTQYVYGCTYEEASNYHNEATADDGSCIFEEEEVCVGDLFEDGYITIQDLMILLAVYGTTCE